VRRTLKQLLLVWLPLATLACGTPGEEELRADREALRSYAEEAKMLDEYSAPAGFARVHRRALEKKADKVRAELAKANAKANAKDR
jgi:hypothetical protein